MTDTAICGRCARDRHDKCLDAGYWNSDPLEGERQCGCDCWRPPLHVAGEDPYDTAQRREFDEAYENTNIVELMGRYRCVIELVEERNRLRREVERLKVRYDLEIHRLLDRLTVANDKIASLVAERRR